MDRPIKIALVTAFDYAVPGGVNSHISALASLFQSWGHPVKIIGPCSEPDDVDDPRFIAMGRPVPIPSRGSIARVSLSPWLRPRVKRVLAEEDFDVIHVHEPFSGYVPYGILGHSKAVNIATFHAYPGSRLYQMGGIQLARPTFRKLHGLIAVSQPALSLVSSRFPGEYELIPNGIRVDDFANGVAPLPEYQDGMINILFFGRLEKRKGLKHLLAAYGKLKWDWPNLRLLVAGRGKPDDDSYRIISERNLQDVVFVGAVSDKERARYFKTADIYCSPATGGESFGVVLLEAMAAGKPIVATSIEGYSTVVSHGEDGLLAPPKDDDALADAIATLLRDPDLRATLAANGRLKAGEYRWERVAKRVMDYYITRLDRVTAPIR